PVGHRKAHHLSLSGEEVVVCVDQVDRHLVRSGRQAEYVDGIAIARIRPQPRQVVDGYVQVPDAWRHLERTFAKYGADTNILRMILDPDQALGQTLRKGRIDNQFGRGLVLDFYVRCGAALPCGLGWGTLGDSGDRRDHGKRLDEAAHYLLLN